MNFLKPDYLWNLLWIIPAFMFFSAMAYRRRKKQLELILGGRAGNPQFSTLSPGKRMVRTILLGSAIIFLVLTAARPSWGTKILPFSGKGRDLLIVLDVSKSMMSQDVQPSRLGHAKWFLRELIKECPGDRFGIVAFAGSAFLQCPMTADKTTLFQAIDEMSVDSIPLGGTNIQQAIETSIQAFKAAESGHRAIILLTDGDEVQGSSSSAIDELKKMKIPMFVVGIGDPSQPGLIMLPDKNGKDPQFLRDSKGELVKSPLNETQLKSIAAETAGIYVRSTATSTGLGAIQKRIKALVPEKYEQGNQTRAIERFHIPLFAAVILLLGFFAVNERRKTPLLVLLLLSANFAIGADDNAIPLTDNQPDSKAVQAASPDKNSSLNVNHEQPLKTSNYEIYNQALELQKKKEFEKAANLYENAISKADADSELISKACQNLGVIKHEAARTLINSKPEDALKILDSAEDLYRESMRALPRLKEVALNQQKLIQDRETAKKILEQKKQMEQKKKEAQQKTKEAQDSQKEKNQESKSKQDQKKDEQKQKNDQQKNDQQKQDGKEQKQEQNKDQQQQNSQQKQDDAQKKTEEAKKAVEDYKKEAQKQDSKESEQSASKAEKEIEKAQEEQKKGNGEKAEENLKNAVKELGESEKNDKNKGDDKKEQDKQKQEQADKNPEKQNGKTQNGQPKEEKEIDPAQAESLLDLMANDEKKLRDEIKEYQRKDSGIRKVDKDW